MIKTISIVVLAIVAGIFIFLYVNETKKVIAYTDKYGEDTLISFFNNPLISEEQKDKKLKSLFNEFTNDKANYTTPIDEEDAIDYKDHFETSINIPLGKQLYPDLEDPRLCPTATWINLKGIRSLFWSLSGFDGLRIYPIRYTRVVTQGGETFPQGAINYMFVFTKKGKAGTHQDQAYYSFDYNHPCPKPPCENH